MRRFIAWSLILAAGASTTSIAAGQAAKPQPAPRAAAPAQRASAPAAAMAKPAAVPLTPEQQKAKQAAEVKAAEEMNQLLSEWEKQSKTVLSLQVGFERTDRSVAWGDQVFQGQAFLKTPDLACLEFKRVLNDANGKPMRHKDASGQLVLDVEKEPFQRIVCTGKEVLQYELDEKAIYIYPLDKEARQKALQQGPLPFLFNMKAADAKKRYGMTLLQQNEKQYLIAIVPREEIDKQNFKNAFVWLNKTNFLPDKLVLYPVADKEKQEFFFTVILPNQPIDDKFFHPPTNLAGWKVNRNEPQVAGAGGGPGAAPAAVPPGRPVQVAPKRAVAAPPRSAMRPSF